MRIITAFFMAWGNFLAVPCPLKRWDDNLKNIMLAMLPSVGAVAGGLWIFVIWLLRLLDGPDSVSAFLAVLAMFMITGLIHLDGYMDVSDAILSRRPLEERQRIMKDSVVGAFAVIAVALLLIGWYSALHVLLKKAPLTYLFMIPVMSRSLSGIELNLSRMIGHSQYKETFSDRRHSGFIAVLLGQLAIHITVSLCLHLLLCTNSYIFPSHILFQTLTALLAARFAKQQLGGMSGDIAGYVICVSELASALWLAFIIQ